MELSIDQLYGGKPLSIENVTEAELFPSKQDSVIEFIEDVKGSAVIFNVTEAVLLVIPKLLSTVYCNLYCPGITLVLLGVITISPLPLKL